MLANDPGNDDVEIDLEEITYRFDENLKSKSITVLSPSC